MDERIKDSLIKELDRREILVSKFKEYVTLEEKIESTPDIEIDSERIIKYLTESGAELTQDNYQRAEQMLKSMEQDDLKATFVNIERSQKEVKNNLRDMDDQELDRMLKIAILNALNNIDMKNVKYEYKIETIKDTFGGGTDTGTLSNVINRYAENGYRIVGVFTNELGKNVVGIGGVSSNTTLDEVIVIFERPIY